MICMIFCLEGRIRLPRQPNRHVSIWDIMEQPVVCRCRHNTSEWSGCDGWRVVGRTVDRRPSRPDPADKGLPPKHSLQEDMHKRFTTSSKNLAWTTYPGLTGSQAPEYRSCGET